MNRPSLIAAWLLVSLACATGEPAESSSTGAAVAVCGGIAGAGCPEGQFCRFDDGTCEVADRQGVCEVRPQICTRDYRPVCGCDGTTHSNRCGAYSAGASIARPGECG